MPCSSIDGLGARETQIPFGDDNQKSKGNSKGKSRSLRGMTAQKTGGKDTPLKQDGQEGRIPEFGQLKELRAKS
jgi:hypothetical protein